MSRMKLLLDVITDMRSLADSLEVLADAMADGDVQKKETVAAKSTKKTTCKVNSDSIPEQETEQNEEIQLEPTVSKDEVLALAKKLSKNGKMEQVRNSLLSYGVSNVSALTGNNLMSFYAELKAMEVE